MSYCVECFDTAEVCFCELEKVILSEYVDGMRECSELKCYCKKHIPKRWFFGYQSKIHHLHIL